MAGLPRLVDNSTGAMTTDEPISTPAVEAAPVPNNKLSTSEAVVSAALHLKTQGWCASSLAIENSHPSIGLSLFLAVICLAF